MADRNIGNLEIGLVGDAAPLQADVAGGLKAMESAFRSSSPEITPVIRGVEFSADAIKPPEIDAAASGFDPLAGALANMTRAASAIGDTLVAGFSQIVPILSRFERGMGDVAAEAKRANHEAWRADMIERADAATSKWAKRFSAVEQGAFRVATVFRKIETVTGNITGLFGRAERFEAPRAPGLVGGRLGGRGGALGSAASGASQGISEALGEASGGSGLGGVLGGIVGGGLAGGIAVLVRDTLEWARSSSLVFDAWERIRGTVGPVVSGLRDALAPAVAMVFRLGDAAASVFSETFAAATANASGRLSALAKSVTDWVRTTVDGGNIVVTAFRSVGHGVAWVVDRLSNANAYALSAAAAVAGGIAALGDGAITPIYRMLDALAPVAGTVLAIGATARELAADVVAAFAETADAIGGWGVMADAVFAGVASGLESAFRSAFPGVIEGLGAVGDAIQFVGGQYAAFAGIALESVGSALGGVLSFAAGVVDGVGSIFPGLYETARSVLEGIAGMVRTVLDPIFRLVDSVREKIPGMTEAVREANAGLAGGAAVGVGRLEELSRSLGDAANAAFSSRAGESVDAFFDKIIRRATEVRGELVKPLDTGFLDGLGEEWGRMLDAMAQKARGLVDGLMTPLDKLALKIGEIDQLRDAGFLSAIEADKLRGKEAAGFLGENATKNAGAMMRGSKEARTAILQYQGGQNDPLRLLPDLAKQHIEATKYQSNILARIANASDRNHATADEMSLLMGD